MPEPVDPGYHELALRVASIEQWIKDREDWAKDREDWANTAIERNDQFHATLEQKVLGEFHNINEQLSSAMHFQRRVKFITLAVVGAVWALIGFVSHHIAQIWDWLPMHHHTH